MYNRQKDGWTIWLSGGATRPAFVFSKEARSKYTVNSCIKQCHAINWSSKAVECEADDGEIYTMLEYFI